MEEQNEAVVNSGKKGKKLKPLVLAVVVIAVAVAAFFGVRSAGRVNVEDYISTPQLEYHGFNGYAIASFDYRKCIDFDGLDNALGKRNLKKVESSLASRTAGDLITGLTIEPNENLKNGDKVTVSLSADLETINQLGYSKKLVSKDQLGLIEYEITVEGLEDAKEFDPFSIIKNVCMTEEGKLFFDYDLNSIDSDENLPISLDTMDYSLSSYSLDIKPTSTIDFGETVEFVVSNSNINDYLSNDGYVLTNMSKKYKIVTVKSFPTEKIEAYKKPIAQKFKEQIEIKNNCEVVKTYFSKNPYVGTDTIYLLCHCSDGKYRVCSTEYADRYMYITPDGDFVIDTYHIRLSTYQVYDTIQEYKNSYESDVEFQL